MKRARRTATYREDIVKGEELLSQGLTRRQAADALGMTFDKFNSCIQYARKHGLEKYPLRGTDARLEQMRSEIEPQKFLIMRKDKSHGVGEWIHPEIRGRMALAIREALA